MDQAKSKDQDVHGHKQERSVNADLDCNVCLPGSHIPEIQVQNSEVNATDTSIVANEFVRKMVADRSDYRAISENRARSKQSDGDVLKVNGTIVMYTKVLYVVTRADTIAGAQNHVMELAEEFSNLNIQTSVICGDGLALPRALDLRSIPFTQVEGFSNEFNLPAAVRFCRLIRAYVRTNKVDLVSLHSTKAGFLGRLACIGLPTKVVYTAHGWGFTTGVPHKRARIIKLLELFASYLTNKIICVSLFDKSIAVEAGISEKKLVVVHNGRSEVPPGSNSLVVPKINPESSCKKLVMVGRLDDQKDHLTLFKALSSSSHDWEVTLVGDGPNLDSLKNESKKLGISDRVNFVGLVDNVQDYLAKADLFCLISNWEGFPRSTLEAMRAGLPVIVSDVGGSKEAVLEGKSGFVIPRGDDRLLAEKLGILIDNPTLAISMGLCGQELFKEKFTLKHMVSQTLTVYDNL